MSIAKRPRLDGKPILTEDYVGGLETKVEQLEGVLLEINGLLIAGETTNALHALDAFLIRNEISY